MFLVKTKEKLFFFVPFRMTENATLNEANKLGKTF